MIPSQVELRVALACEKEIYRDYVDCWGDVGGIDYSPLREEAVKACYVTSLSARDLLSEPEVFFKVDFADGEWPDTRGEMTLTACRAGEVNGIALWFDAELAPGVHLSSSPWSRTHWQQCFAPVDEPIGVRRNDQLSVLVEMNLRKKPSDSFSFRVNIELEDDDAW